MEQNVGSIWHNSMNIGVLTYNVKHRKTYDVLCLLKALGYNKVSVYAVPLQYKKTFQPVLQHRPEMVWPVDIEVLCKNFSFQYNTIEDYSQILERDGSIMLVGGAALLPDAFIRKYCVINAHPGYIPNCRGLDAFKWAVYERQPIGVTSHIIGEEIDAGEILLREKVPVYLNDTFFATAQRVYENEIRVLVESISFVCSNKKREYISGEGFTVHKRMPKNIEKRLLECFEEYKIGVLDGTIS